MGLDFVDCDDCDHVLYDEVVKMGAENVALSVLTFAEVAHFFSAFNPSIFTIKRFPDEHTKEDIMMGCLLATIFGLVLAFAVSYLTKSKAPFFVSLIGIGAMNAIYLYYAFRSDKVEANPINKQEGV